MKEFKVGDKVYFPTYSNKVYTLVKKDSDNYPFSIVWDDNSEYFTSKGTLYKGHMFPCIFHATQENKELLEKLHGIEFEAAPPKTRTVTFEIPETFLPNYGEEYWFIHSVLNGEVNTTHNDGSPVDIQRIKQGAWRTKENALQAVEALNNIQLGV